MATSHKQTPSINSTVGFGQEENLFSRYCSKEWKQILAQQQTAFMVNAGSFIFREGEQVKGVYLINYGHVKVVSDHGRPNERILRLAGADRMLGHRGYSTELFPVSAIALTESLITFVPKETFRTLIRTNPELADYLINFMASELRESEERMKNYLQAEVQERVAFILLYLASSFGFDPADKTKLEFTLSRKDFANMAGTTYESIIRTLTQLQKKKLIRTQGKDIFIDQLSKLEQLISK